MSGDSISSDVMSGGGKQDRPEAGDVRVMLVDDDDLARAKRLVAEADRMAGGQARD